MVTLQEPQLTLRETVFGTSAKTAVGRTLMQARGQVVGQPLQTGPRGGKFYQASTGAKVYPGSHGARRTRARSTTAVLPPGFRPR